MGDNVGGDHSGFEHSRLLKKDIQYFSLREYFLLTLILVKADILSLSL